MGEFGLTSLKTGKWIWIILKRDYGLYLCCRNYGCYGSTVGRDERQLWVVAREMSFKRTPLCATCTGTKMNEMMVNDGCRATQGLLASMMRWMHSAADEGWNDEPVHCILFHDLQRVVQICCVDLLCVLVRPLLHSTSAFFCWWWRQIVVVVIIFRVFLGSLCWYWLPFMV